MTAVTGQLNAKWSVWKMKIKTVDGDFMISSFDLSPDDLVKIACACCSALAMKYPSPHLPRLIINENDKFYGNSVWVNYRYHKEVEENKIH